MSRWENAAVHRDEIERRLAAHGLTPRELRLLGNVWLEQAPPDDFALYSIEQPVRGPTDLTTEQRREVGENRIVLDGLMARGLIVILREADLEAERARRAASQVPEGSRGFRGARPGFVDYSPEGYALYRGLIPEIYGPDFLARHDASSEQDRASDDEERTDRRVQILAPSTEVCAALMDDLSESYRVVRREGPTPIGPWRPNRFVLLPQGFRATLRYEPWEVIARQA
jgi:hypothetical protein